MNKVKYTQMGPRRLARSSIGGAALALALTGCDLSGPPSVSPLARPGPAASDVATDVHIGLVGADGAADLVLMDVDPSRVCTGIQFRDGSGRTQSGTRNCPDPLSPCNHDGAIDCLATDEFPAAAVTGLAAKVVTGQTVAGVAGTAPGSNFPACASDGASNCWITTAFLAVNANTLLPTSIMAGVTIGGVAGVWMIPNCVMDGTTECVATSKITAVKADGLAPKVLAGTTVAGISGTAVVETHSNCEADGAVGCLTTSTFKAAKISQATSSNIAAGTTFAGVAGIAAIVASCTIDGQQNCSVSGPYKAANITGMSAWDVRVGKSLAGISGALKTNCRNSINSTHFNWDGAIGSLPNTAQSGGTTNDYWDTIDDYYGFSSTQVAGWSSNTLCDSSTWTDVTTVDGGMTTITCAASSANCQYRDKISNLVVTKNIGSATWSGALQACNSSFYGGFNAGTWRLPTQKELMSLYEHGLASLASANFMTIATMQGSFWSSTTNSSSSANGWSGNLMGPYFGNPKNNSYGFFCVR